MLWKITNHDKVYQWYRHRLPSISLETNNYSSYQTLFKYDDTKNKRAFIIYAYTMYYTIVLVVVWSFIA